MEGSPPERDVLLATKLQVPRSRSGLVPRRRLADRLEEGLNRGLVLVAAPAGYGKSVLLSEWVRGMTGPVAWLSLDAGGPGGRGRGGAVGRRLRARSR